MATAIENDFESDIINKRTFTHGSLHAKKLLIALNETRNLDYLCDSFVRIGDKQIAVQKGILAAASPYFRSLYCYGTNAEEDVVPIKAISLDPSEVNEDTFGTILDYIYTSEITLSESNIQAILQAADMLLMTDLKALCCEYLEQCISTQNCLGIQQFAELFTCPWVLYKVNQFIDDNISDISICEEFHKLTPQRLSKLLGRDTLNVTYEYEVFDMLAWWHHRDPVSRSQFMPDLIKTCLHKDDAFLEEHGISSPDQCESLYDMSVVFQIKKTLLHSGKCLVLVVSGGEKDGKPVRDPEVVDSIHCMCLKGPPPSQGDRWIKLAPMQTPRLGHGLVEAGGCLYVVGGRDNQGQVLATGECYNPRTNTWTEIAPMHYPRIAIGLVSLDSKIYAISGGRFTGMKCISEEITTAEVYDIYKNEWRLLPASNIRRVWAAHAVWGKKIYLIGGAIYGKLFESVECFDTISETWTSISPLKERRFDAKAVGTDRGLFVFGGLRRLECPSAMHNSQDAMKFCQTEVLTEETGHWSPVTSRGFGMCSMTSSCHLEGAVSDGTGLIYVVGELDIDGRYQCVRAFNLHTLEWCSVMEYQPPGQRSYQTCLLEFPLGMLQTICLSQ